MWHITTATMLVCILPHIIAVQHNDNNIDVEDKIKISKLFRFIYKQTDKTRLNRTEPKNETNGKNKTILKNKLRPKSISNDTKYDELADYIMKFVFENYPDYKIPLLTEALINKSIHMAYSGFIMEVKQPLNDYKILLTDSYRKQRDDVQKRIEEYPTAYQCTNAIRYCSLHPTFCEYQEGSVKSKIVISVSQGGAVISKSYKARKSGCFINGQCMFNQSCSNNKRNFTHCSLHTFKRNINSKEIGTALRDRLEVLFGLRPHLVIMNLHSSFIDVDQYVDEGAINDVRLRSVWYDYHKFISQSLSNIKDTGLLLDIRSHMTNDSFVELDYNLEPTHIDSKTADFKIEKSSLDFLINQTSLTPYDLIYGKNSLGYYLQTRSIEARPSPNFDYVNITSVTSSYAINKLYSSYYGGPIDSIKITIPKKYYETVHFKEFVEKLSDSVFEFHHLNYENKDIK